MIALRTLASYSGGSLVPLAPSATAIRKEKAGTETVFGELFDVRMPVLVGSLPRLTLT